MREANKSLSKSVETSLKASDMSLKNLQLENTNFKDNSVKATIHIFYDVDLFVRFDNDDEIPSDYLTFNK